MLYLNNLCRKVWINFAVLKNSITFALGFGPVAQLD